MTAPQSVAWRTLALVVLACSAAAQAETNLTVRFGDSAYRVPIPAQFAIAPAEANHLRTGVATMFGTNAELLAILIPQGDAEKARAGKTIEFNRILMLIGAHGSFEEITTTSYIFFRPRILQLVAGSSDGDLTWTRQAAKDWTAQICAANPLQ